MRVLEFEAFFTELSKLYDQRKGSGSVWVTAKRTSKPIKWEKGASKPRYDPRCLVRATDGKRKKISYVVNAKDQARFQQRLISTFQVHTEAMQKRKKTKKKPAAT